MARTPYDEVVEEVVEEFAHTTGGSVDRYKYLVLWMAQKVDFSKVDSQATLLRWMDRIIDEEAERLNIDRKDYERRFKGMIKFLRDPHLAWRGVIVPYQNQLVEHFISEISERGAVAKTLKEYQEILRELEEFTLPPAAQPIYRRQIERLRQSIGQTVDLLQRAERLAEKYAKADLSKMPERDIYRAFRNVQKVRRYIQARVTAIDVIHDLRAAEERLLEEYRRRTREFVRRLLEARRQRR